ncbi:hypothetical protein [Comamonas terrigena]|uniref:hypothetical protein n=1 Tax=Comamonas terrigena TaxID=32013 RepID=UPI0022393E87|nr:hypothetical protein [Comamonas terrigena]
MIATLLFLAFLGLMFVGVPIGAALGLAVRPRLRWPMPMPSGSGCWPCRRTSMQAWASTRCLRSPCSFWWLHL